MVERDRGREREGEKKIKIIINLSKTEYQQLCFGGPICL